MFRTRTVAVPIFVEGYIFDDPATDFDIFTLFVGAVGVSSRCCNRAEYFLMSKESSQYDHICVTCNFHDISVCITSMCKNINSCCPNTMIEINLGGQFSLYVLYTLGFCFHNYHLKHLNGDVLMFHYEQIHGHGHQFSILMYLQ